MAAFATIADLQARYPRELLVLAADEETGLRDDARVQAVLGDVSAEIRSILLTRYGRRDLDRPTPETTDVLRVFAMAMALYRVALSFARSSERLEKGYDDAVKRLQAIADGKGTLSFEGDDAEPAAEPGLAVASSDMLIAEGPERVFTRDRLRDW